jgi:hypothetical protein
VTALGHPSSCSDSRCCGPVKASAGRFATRCVSRFAPLAEVSEPLRRSRLDLKLHQDRGHLLAFADVAASIATCKCPGRRSSSAPLIW